MRIAKYIFLLLLLISLALSVFIITQPPQFSVEVKQELKAPLNVTYSYINDFSTWKDWFVSFSNNNTNPKAVYNTNFQTNTTKITKQKNVPDTLFFLVNESFFNGTTELVFNQKDKKTTIINWKLNGEISLKKKFLSFFSGGIENDLKSSMKLSLNNLNTQLNTTIYKYEILINGFETVKETPYISILDTTGILDFDENRNKNLIKLKKLQKQHNLKTANAPFVIFKTWDTITAKSIFETCIPINNVNDSLASLIKVKYRNSFLALKTTLNGNYQYRSDTWNEAFKAIKISNYKQNPKQSYIEIYKNIDTKIPANNNTEFYIPVYIPKTVIAKSHKLDSLNNTTQIINNDSITQ